MPTIKYLFKQLVKALFHLHQVNRLAHCDLKPENLIITDDFRLCIIDFGLAQPSDRNYWGKIGTEEYLAPEVRATNSTPLASQTPFDPKKVDVFTTGMILFLLATGLMPFHKATQEDGFYSLIATN